MILDDDDQTVREFVNRRRSIDPINYRELSKRLLSFMVTDDIETVCMFTNEENNQLSSMQNAVYMMQSKLQDKLFDEREIREIQRIVLNDDDDVLMHIPLPQPIQIKAEPINHLEMMDVPAIDNNGSIDLVCGQIPFITDVSLILFLACHLG